MNPLKPYSVGGYCTFDTYEEALKHAQKRASKEWEKQGVYMLVTEADPASILPTVTTTRVATPLDLPA